MKKIILSLTLVVWACISAWAQEKKVFTPEGDTTLQEVLISATKFPEKKKFIVQKTDIITAKTIARTNAQNSGDLLQSTGNIFVQKSQQGGSSPVIRGFEASRVLLIIDGVRMNNAIYRSGHLQNVITIDQNMLERVEVLYGPGSTLHGSDALGGVVAFKTKDPQLSEGKKTSITGGAFSRYSSANAEKTVHGDINFGGAKWAGLISANYSDFGDMTMGKNYPSKYPDFGRRLYYADRINGIDSIVKNTNPNVQKFSGYQQWDFMGKLLYQQNARVSHLINFQLSSSSNVPRYDRLQDIRNGSLRYADWHYGPQKRKLLSYNLTAALNGFFNTLKVTASYQQIEESRYQRDRNNLNRLNRIENLDIGGLTADLRKKWKNHELHTGIDMQLNKVGSKAYTQNILSGIYGPLDTRYPEKNTYNSYGIYAQHLLKLDNNKLVVNDGLRLQGTKLESTVIDKTTAFRPFDHISQNPVGLSGNLGLTYMPNQHWRISTGVATGFRSPNIDDLTKIFESSTSSRQLVVANPDINPEKTISPELSVTTRIGNFIKLDFTAFYTWYKDAIVKDRYPVNGQDSSLYNGIKYLTLAAQNNAKARLYGYNAAITITPAKGWELYSTINYSKGTYTRPSGMEIPLDHIPPVFGKTSLRYSQGKWSIEAWSMYNGWKKTKDYNPDGEDNAQYATADGMPAWVTYNIKTQVEILKNMMVQLAVENVADRNYRQFASGFSAPGRNFLLALRINF